MKGPIFAQIILADEINRTPPKTQAALLEAMQEYHVTAAGRTYQLERPFFVLATQNPIELEGTYPLPEAQLDRFLFNVVMTYLSEDDEVQVVTDTTSLRKPEPARVLSGADILQIQDYVRQVLVAEEVVRYAVRLTDSSRPGRGAKLDFIEKWVKWGAGLRASHALVIGAKARALLHGRHHVSVKDIQALAKPIFRHRVLPNFYAEAEGITVGPHRRSAARRGPGSRQRVVDPRIHGWRAGTLSRSGDRRAARHDRSQGAHDRRRVPDRPAPQSLQGIQRRVRGVSAVPARRRSGDARLEGVRAIRQALRQEIRRRNQPHVPPAARRQRIDGLRLAAKSPSCNTRRT